MRFVVKLTHSGVDKDAGIENLCEFDIEIRRRVWTLLYNWDWQMASWLGRPNLIDQKNLTFKFPNLRLDESTTAPGLPSPFAHMVLQADLGRRVATIMADAQSVSDLTTEQVLAVEADCEDFIQALPPVFGVRHPDTSFDEEHQYIVFQRLQLHCVTFVTMLDLLKPYLTRDRRDRMTEKDDEFRKMGIDIALRLLPVARDLFSHEFPINAKFHMVVFSIFDVSSGLVKSIVRIKHRLMKVRPLPFCARLLSTTGTMSYLIAKKSLKLLIVHWQCCNSSAQPQSSALPRTASCTN
jgi:hypothetical protein